MGSHKGGWKRRSGLALAAGIWLWAGAVQAEDWPQFRGPRVDGVSAEKDLPLTWSATENLVWKTPLPGPGASSPATLGGKIFVTAYSGYFAQGAGRPGDPGDIKQLAYHVLALAAADGKVLWDVSVPASRGQKPATTQVNLHGYAPCTPAVDARAVYVFLGNEGLFAFDHAGQQLWRAETGPGAHGWGDGASPVLAGNLVLVNAAVESGSLLAFDRQTGQKVWSQTGLRQVWSTPVPVRVNDRDELVVSTENQLVGFAPATGQRLWWSQGIKDYVCPTPVVQDGIVYALGARKSAGLAVRAGGTGDVTQTHTVWNMPAGSNVSSPVLAGDYLYWTHERSGLAYCAEKASGNIVYQEKLPGSPMFYGSPLLAAGRIYYPSRNHGVFVVAAKPEFALLAQNRIAADPSVSNACPVPLAPGRLLLRTDWGLYCVGK